MTTLEQALAPIVARDRAQVLNLTQVEARYRAQLQRLAHIVARDHAQLLRLFAVPAMVLDWQHLHTMWFARRGGKKVLNGLAFTIERGRVSGVVELDDARTDAWRLTEAGRAAWAARRSMDDEIAGSAEAR